MSEKLCSKWSITADTAFRKIYPAGVHDSTRTRSCSLKNQIVKNQRGNTTCTLT